MQSSGNSNKFYKALMQGLLSALLMLGLSACSSDNADLKKYIKGVKKRPAQAIEPLPSFKPLPKYTYPQISDRRDPFAPLIVEKKVEDNYKPDFNRKRQALENYPLDALKYVGVLRHGVKKWALIIAPDMKVHKLTRGHFIGKNYGRVVRIDDLKIDIVERVKIGGKWRIRQVSIAINAKE